MEIKPNRGTQERFLESREDIVIYGGARGGGKTWALLLECLYHIDNPKFTAVIFRRTYPQIKTSGGLWEKSYELFSRFGAIPNLSNFKWTFPSGATVRFSHCNREDDKFIWQGSEICYLGFDELTHFSYTQFLFLLTANRSTSGIKPFIRATCNPDPNSWVKSVIKPWINDDGYADKKVESIKINFQQNEMKFEGDLSLRFINADIYDNPKLMEKDPEYLKKLQNLPHVLRERFLGKKGKGGNWNIKEEAGEIFKRHWLKIRSDLEGEAKVKIRFWDFGSKSEKNIKTGDFSVGLLMGYYEKFQIFVVEDIIRFRRTDAETDKIIRITAENDGSKVFVRWQIEPGASGKRDNSNLIKLLKGFNAYGIYDNRDKVSRALPVSKMCEFGGLELLKAKWNEDFLLELDLFPNLCNHDDQVDSFSGAYNSITLAKPRKTGNIR